MQPAPTEQPASLVVHSAGSVTVYINPDCTGEVDAQALLKLPDAVAALAGRSTRQRGRTTWWELPCDEAAAAPLVVRLYAHGGALGPLLGTRFLSAARMLEELRVHIHASLHGVPTSMPIALRVEQRGRASCPAPSTCWISARARPPKRASPPNDAAGLPAPSQRPSPACTTPAFATPT